MINMRFLLSFIIVSFSLSAMSNNGIPTLKELSLKSMENVIELEFTKQLGKNNGDVDKSLAGLKTEMFAKIQADLHVDIKEAYRKAKGYSVDPPFYIIVDYRHDVVMSDRFKQMMLKYALQQAVKKKNEQLKNKVFASASFARLKKRYQKIIRGYALQHGC